MDAALDKLIAPTVKEIEDLWGIPLTDPQKACVLAGFAAGVTTQRNRVCELYDLLVTRQEPKEDQAP